MGRELVPHDLPGQAARDVAEELGVGAWLPLPTAGLIAAILDGAGDLDGEVFPDLVLPTAGSGPLAPKVEDTASAAGD